MPSPSMICFMQHVEMAGKKAVSHAKRSGNMSLLLGVPCLPWSLVVPDSPMQPLFSMAKEGLKKKPLLLIPSTDASINNSTRACMGC